VVPVLKDNGQGSKPAIAPCRLSESVAIQSNPRPRLPGKVMRYWAASDFGVRQADHPVMPACSCSNSCYPCYTLRPMLFASTILTAWRFSFSVEGEPCACCRKAPFGHGGGMASAKLVIRGLYRSPRSSVDCVIGGYTSQNHTSS
jgi:hypothetical protein